MRVLLINPQYRLHPPFDAYDLCDPPLNLTWIAAVLREDGVSVKIFDMPILGKALKDIRREVLSYNPDIIGIANRSTYSFPIVQQTAKIVREVGNNAKIIVGGTHVSLCPKEAMTDLPDVDVIVVGEGEYTMRDLAHAIKKDSSFDTVRGIVFRSQNGTIVETKPRPLIMNLDELPLPAVDLLPVERYVSRGERYVLQTSRGCPYSCSFCTSGLVPLMRGKVRYRSTEKVIEEIESAVRKYGFRDIYFCDDTFTLDKKRIIDLCDKISEHSLDFRWSCLTRVDRVDPMLLTKMHEVGCKVIGYGVETGSQKILDDMEKGQTLKQAVNAFQWTKKAGIMGQALVMIGVPSSTKEDEIATIKFLLSLDPDAVGVFIFKPYPGTKYYVEPEKNGIRIMNKDLSKWSILDEPVHETESLSRRDIIEVALLYNHIFRSNAFIKLDDIKPFVKPEIVYIKTEEGGLVYNPYLPNEKKKTDLYLNCHKLNTMGFEIFLRCDGHHNINEITGVFMKLFDHEKVESFEIVCEFLEELDSLGIIYALSDLKDYKKLNLEWLDVKINEERLVERTKIFNLRLGDLVTKK